MPRKARNSCVSSFYHIMVQGDEKKSIFKKNYYKDKFIYLLKRNAFRNDVKLIAYCVMDNHTHILVHTKEIERISKMMSQCNTSYGMFFSNERKNVGHVFRDRYRTEAICAEKYLINCIKYIHQNPVKANVVDNCGEYMFSSYNEYLKKVNPIYENVKDVCGFFDDQYEEIIKNERVDFESFDDDTNENVKRIFDEVMKEYSSETLTEKEIVDIYFKVKKQCKVKKSQIASLLNIKRTTFLGYLRRQGGRS